jgi:hypothetical protein
MLSGVELKVLCELCAGHSRFTFDLDFVERECAIGGAC